MNCEKCEGCKHKFEPSNCNTNNNNTKQPLPKISSLWLGLTEACNLKCRYCFVHQNPANMTYEMAVKGVDWLAEQQPSGFHVQFFGGEPLLRWNEVIVPLVIYTHKVYPKRASFGLTTNGILLDEEKLKFLKDNNIDLLFSIDGNKECQDVNRPLPNGNSSFDILVNKLPIILKYFPDVTFRMTIDNSTVHTIYENHRFAVEQGFVNTFGAINQFPNWTEKEFEELERQYYKVADLFIENIKNGKFVNINPMVRMLDRIYQNEHSTVNHRVHNNLAGYGKCGIGAGTGTVLAPTGKFYSCQETYTNEITRDHYYMGDIDNGVSDELRYKIFKDVNPYINRSSNKLMKCENCYLNNLCDGGCPVRNYDVSNDHNIVPFSYCVNENILYEVGLYIREQLKDNKLFREKVRM